MVDRLQYDPQIVDSMLWKFDSVAEQVRESKGESEIAANAGASMGGGLEGKAGQAARSVAKGRSDYLLWLGAYKEALLKVESKVEGADVDSTDSFKRSPCGRNEIIQLRFGRRPSLKSSQSKDCSQRKAYRLTGLPGQQQCLSTSERSFEGIYK